MIERPDYQMVSINAANIARRAMYIVGARDSGASDWPFKDDIRKDLESCAAALGYKLVKADAPADVVLSR